MPKGIAATLNVAAAMKLSDHTPEDFAAFVKAEIRQWTEVGRAANIQSTE